MVFSVFSAAFYCHGGKGQWIPTWLRRLPSEPVEDDWSREQEEACLTGGCYADAHQAQVCQNQVQSRYLYWIGTCTGTVAYPTYSTIMLWVNYSIWYLNLPIVPGDLLARVKLWEGGIPTSAEGNEFSELVAEETSKKLKRFRENRTPANYLELQKDLFLMIVTLNTKRERDVANLRLDDIQNSIWREESDSAHTPLLAHTPRVCRIWFWTFLGRGFMILRCGVLRISA